MANRKPFSPKLQLYYNIFHLVLNIYLFYEASVTGWLTGYSFRCQSVDFARVGMPLRVCFSSKFYIKHQTVSSSSSDGKRMLALLPQQVHWLLRDSNFRAPQTLRDGELVSSCASQHHAREYQSHLAKSISLKTFLNIWRSRSGGAWNFWRVSLCLINEHVFNLFISIRWTLDVFWIHQHRGAYRNLFILCNNHSLAKITTILFLVESFLSFLSSELFLRLLRSFQKLKYLLDWTVCHDLPSRFPTSVEQWLQLPNGLRVLYRRTRRAFLSLGAEQNGKHIQRKF